MVSISFIAVATALLICAVLAKVFAKEPKANKSQKAEIIARLLALSEEEKRASGTAPSAGLRRPVTTGSSMPGYKAAIHSKPATWDAKGRRNSLLAQRRTKLAGSSS